MPATVSVIWSARERLLLPVEVVTGDVNRFLRGWAGYFRYGTSARRFDGDHDLRDAAAGPLRGKAPQAVVPLRLVGRGSRLTGSFGSDQPQWMGRRTPPQLGLAGKAECRR